MKRRAFFSIASTTNAGIATGIAADHSQIAVVEHPSVGEFSSAKTCPA